jgi:hypothetical protein
MHSEEDIYFSSICWQDLYIIIIEQNLINLHKWNQKCRHNEKGWLGYVMTIFNYTL